MTEEDLAVAPGADWILGCNEKEECWAVAQKVVTMCHPDSPFSVCAPESPDTA